MPERDKEQRGPPRPGLSAGPRPRPAFTRPPLRPTGPISLETVAALARKERVPLRIAKGELEGKMKCRIWRKLHAEEARRFDQAYALVAANPDLSLADAFGVLQSGLAVEELRARRVRTQKRTQVKEARQGVSGDAVKALVEAWVTAKEELAVVLAERAVVDVLEAELPVALKLTRTGRLEKLKVVLATPRALWDSLASGTSRDGRLVQRPAPVPREPERRPYADPRPFVPFLDRTVRLGLRNGINLEETLRAVGPFDLILRSLTPGEAILVPLHAVVRWEDEAPPQAGTS